MQLDDKLKCVAALSYAIGYFAPTDRTEAHRLPAINRGIEQLTEALEIIKKEEVAPPKPAS
jgi:hypothetical protein